MTDIRTGQVVWLRICDHADARGSEDAKPRRAVVLDRRGDDLVVVVAGTSAAQAAMEVVTAESHQGRCLGLQTTTYFPESLVLLFETKRVSADRDRRSCPRALLKMLQAKGLRRIELLWQHSAPQNRAAAKPVKLPSDRKVVKGP